jgi:predicted MPP superfamily phosphohydrolase
MLLSGIVDRISLMSKRYTKFSRRDFLRIMKEALISLIALSSGSLIYSFGVEPGWLEVDPIEIPVSGLRKSFSGFRLAQVSDLHMGGWMNRARLHEVLAAIHELKPDLVAMTGDFVYGHFWTESLDVVAEDFISEVALLTAEFRPSASWDHDH